MFRTNANARTVWVKDLTTEQRQGNSGPYDAKSILFRIATDRNYTRTVMKDGKQVEERPTDFALCRANGALAEIIANHCKAVDAAGKLISRHLALWGHFEMYQSKRTFKVENLPVSIPNVGTFNLNFDTEQNVDGLIFVVDEMEFLDKKPTPTVQAQGATVSNVSVTPQQANVVPNGYVAAQGQTIPVQPAQAPVGVTVQATAGTTQDATGAMMNTPVVPDGYNGQTAPF